MRIALRLCLGLLLIVALASSLAYAESGEYKYAKYAYDNTGASWEVDGRTTYGTQLDIWKKAGVYTTSKPEPMNVTTFVNSLVKQGWELVSSEQVGAGEVYHFRKKVK